MSTIPSRTIAGWFSYRVRGGGWEDSFTVIDDDGMSFVLDDLKAFEGRAVRITIEEAPELDAQSRADTVREPLLYQQIGMTRAAAWKRREARR